MSFHFIFAEEHLLTTTSVSLLSLPFHLIVLKSTYKQQHLCRYCYHHSISFCWEALTSNSNTTVVVTVIPFHFGGHWQQPCHYCYRRSIYFADEHWQTTTSMSLASLSFHFTLGLTSTLIYNSPGLTRRKNRQTGYLLAPDHSARQTAQQRPHAGRVLAPARGGDALLPPLRPGDVQPGTQPRLPPRRTVAGGGGGASQSGCLRLRLGGGRGQFSSLLPKPQTNQTGFAWSLWRSLKVGGKNGMSFSRPWERVKTERGLWKFENFVIFRVLGWNYQLIIQKLFPQDQTILFLKAMWNHKRCTSYQFWLIECVSYRLQ